MSDLVKFRIPVPFVLARLLPTPAELGYGFEHGWIGENEAIGLALAMYEECEVPPEIEEIALLLADEAWRVPELIDRAKGSAGDDGSRAWLFVALAWVAENQDDFLDPYEAIEMLYADFGYPDAIAGLVRFIPPPPGEPVGMTALDARWRAYLKAESDWFSARRRGPS